MMGIFKKFLKDKKLELCTDKSKILVFNKRRKEKKEKWIWGGKVIEEVQDFKYLGFMISYKRGYKEHIKKLNRKSRMVTRKVWGLGKRIFRNDFKRKWILFRYLVQNVMVYGVTLWRWETKEELEKVMLDYVRWVFRLDFCTPRYIITRELKIIKLRVGCGIRARRYEERIKMGVVGKLAEECWQEKAGYNWEDTYARQRERILTGMAGA